MEINVEKLPTEKEESYDGKMQWEALKTVAPQKIQILEIQKIQILKILH